MCLRLSQPYLARFSNPQQHDFSLLSQPPFVTIQFTARRKFSHFGKNIFSFGFFFSSLAGGASYSPEYYINIRTGIHYFPKGNASADAGSNRFKSGLNRIEEKNDEVIATAFQLFAILFHCLLSSPVVSEQEKFLPPRFKQSSREISTI
jgi:hypothetical protein